MNGYTWAAFLVMVIVVCGVLIGCALKTGTDENKDNARQTTDEIIGVAVLDNLGGDGGLQAAMDAVAEASAEEAPDLDENTIDAIAVSAAPAVATAVLAIPAAAALNLAPALEALRIPEVDETAQAIIEDTIENLTLEPDEVADPETLEIELSRAAELAIIDLVPSVSAEQRDELETTAASALAVALDDSLTEVQETVADELDDNAQRELGEERQDFLSGAGDITLITLAAAIGALAVGEFFRAGTKAYVPK